MAPQTDIIIPIHNAIESFRNCIETLFAYTKDFRLILVDDFSSPDALSYILSVLHRQPVALLIKTSQQKWFTRASNIGLRMVRTERAILLNSDCVLGEGWLDEMYGVWDEAATQGHRVGLVGSTQSEPEPRRWAAAVNPGYVTGHCYLLSMAVLQEVSQRRGTPGWYFDETRQDTIHISSDRTLCWDLNAMGYSTIASHKAAVGHQGGQSWNYDLGRVGRLRLGSSLTGEVLS